MGRADYLKLGTWNALCDRCQRKYKADELKEEWTGWMVCERCWEPRHPQDFLKGHPDNPQVDWTRPDSDADGNEYNGDVSKDLYPGVNNEIQNWNVALTTDKVAVLKSTNASAGERFIIYKTVDDGNTLIITSTLRDSGVTV